MKINRRDLIKLSSLGIAGSMSGCLPDFERLLGRSRPLKNIVFLTMNGGVSQMESFDYKPELFKKDGMSISLPENDTAYSIITKPKVSFKQYGESGAWVSSAFPETAKIVDKLTFVKSCQNFSFDHYEAMRYLFTGTNLNDQPSIMAWLGHLMRGQNKRLPSSITMFDQTRTYPPFSEGTLASGYLPDKTKSYQLESEVVKYILDSKKDTRSIDISQELLKRLNSDSLLKHHQESKQRARVFNEHELFQKEILTALDIEKEPEHVKNLYGLYDPKCYPFANRLIKARRMLEQGVKVINVHSGGFGLIGWDNHQDFKEFHKISREVDKPIAGFILDLEQRGLLDETLVVFWTEFGRLPCQESLGKEKDSKIGRDHNPSAFTIWFAGGGVKPGQTIGETDELSHKAVEDIYNVRDIHHTIFKLVGIDLNELYFKDEGKTKVFFKEKGRMIKGLV